MTSLADIYFEERHGEDGTIGIITLRRVNALNALNHDMFLSLYEQLTHWEKSPLIKAVIIRAASGRAFCAGGDIRYAYELKMKNDPNLINFFTDEYRLDRLIYHYKKPYIALLDGITMGGGVGLSIFASHQMATERMVFAMPETGIGFYPDIGASYFLSRLPSYIGYYLGLTGAMIAYNDCLALGIVNYVISHDMQETIIAALVNAPLPDIDAVSRLLNQFNISSPASDLLTHKNCIEHCFSKSSVEDIIAALVEWNDRWSQDVAANLKTKSPTSLKVTLAALQRGEKQDYDTCMDMELAMTKHFLHSHDFFEGIRATVIDKDRKPRWRPSQLNEVTVDCVNEYFER